MSLRGASATKQSSSTHEIASAYGLAMTQKMIHLLLAIHNHQPVGNFEHVFGRAFKECYWPLLETLMEFPKVKATLHHSGPLLDWALEHEPEYLPTLIKLIKRGQVEPLGGGYYEPILAVIPPHDARGQIEMMKDFWREKIGFAPRGIWTTERIWEPSLTTLLAENKVEYTILDDEHFRAAGVAKPEITGYYLTERHGRTVAVFASDKTLRYFIPFKMPEDVISHLLWLSERYDGSCITYGDDGEKFGIWPGTHEWVVKKGWLKKFFSLLTEQAEKVRTATVSEYLDSHKPEGTVYLPTCSYHEMGEWAMPADSARKMAEIKNYLTEHGKWDSAKTFIRGGYWDNFLTKYPEANYMHKRMLWVSRKISKHEARSTKHDKNIENARKALYRAQCNCAYWHGLFGGLYLNYLRHAIWKNLIEAENLLEAGRPAFFLVRREVVAEAGESDPTKVGHPKAMNPNIEIVDIDCDSSNEVIMKTGELIAVIKPNFGACLIELSHRKSGLNLQDVLTRREEAYHKKPVTSDQWPVTSEKQIASIHDIGKQAPENISYDICRRHSFNDHIILQGGETFHLCNSCYKLASHNNESAVLEFENDLLHVQKIYRFVKVSAIEVQYQISPMTEIPVEFSTELNLSLLAGHDESRYFLLPDGSKHLMDVKDTIEGLDSLSLVDEYFNFRLCISSDKKMKITRYPVYTVSQSESGFDLLYQGSCIIWSNPMLADAKESGFKIILEFK